MATGGELTARLRALGIRQAGDPILARPAEPFSLPGERGAARALEADLLSQLGRLQALYPFNKGVGIAAPQVGVPRAMAVVMPAGGTPFTLVNPVVLDQSDEDDRRFEGCLSFFGVRGRVPRPLRVRVRHLDLDGRALVDTYERAVARLALHEIDHLEGRLYTERLPAGERLVRLEDYRQAGTAWTYPDP